jgi:glycosyltransferase involved in cell wall biosynthesis
VRVLLVTANYRPSVGGIERFAEILAEGLAERGHEVTVVTGRHRGGPAVEERAGVRIVRLRASDVLRKRLGVPYPLVAPWGARRLAALVRQADVVHAQDALYVTTVAALLLARRWGVSSVLTQHVAFVPQGSSFLDLAQRLAIRTLGRSARLASVVASYNPQVAEWARRTWQLRDVRLLPVGVPAQAISDDEHSAARRELGIADDVFLAIFTGRDVPKKRLDVFLRATDPSYELVAVTDRVDRASAARLVPFMDADRFSRLLAASDAFVLPSQAEGFPLALQEALVAGVPCIVTREPGYERFLDEGDVVFVPPEPEAIRAALRRLATEPRHRSELAAAAGEAGRRRFGVDAFVDAYERLYAALRVDSTTN